jgi:eukaryotic-like serine/threonine-protein kinase
MADKIGRFELVSQLAQSPTATIYKALDTENQQTVALKVVQLSAVKDGAALLKSVLEEADQAKPLSSHNIAVLYGVGEEDGKLLAATEYVQGNSIATTLARHEGFSIWDTQDIARQVCHALDHAQGHEVVHQSLEPAKIMVQWDGQAKILGFGISSMSAHAAESGGAVPDVMHYAAPEQLRGEACDHRSTIFSLGAILYEMATEQKAFPGETAEQVKQAVLESEPPLPVRLKANMNPVLSQLIMKALAKSPEERYQSGKELVGDLEQCKSSNNLAAKANPQKAKAAAAGASPAAPNSAASGPTSSGLSSSAAPSAAVSPASPALPAPAPSAPSRPKITASAAGVATAEAPKSGFTVDPMMAEDENSPAAKARRSFSELSEMPPLKAEFVAPPAPPPSAQQQPEVAEPLPQVIFKKPEEERASVQVREAAQKAVSEIRKTPPKLFLYAVGGAVFIIAIILVGMSMSSYWQDRETEESGSAAPAQTQPSPAAQAPQPQQPAPAPQTQAAAAAPDNTQAQPEAPAPSEDSARNSRERRMKSHAVAAAPVPGQLTVSSSPTGVQITFDGSPLCVTPCTLTGIAPGQHTILASKSGYGSENRNLVLAAGANSTISISLSGQTAKLSVGSTPAGATILVDGQDTGKLSPAQFILNRPGAHTVVLRRAGYLEETSTVNADAGQMANVNLVLKQLGNTEDIRAAGGHFKKVFGGSDTASMGIVSIKTTPKGAQIMVNNRVLDKTAPFDFYLNPGTYVIDISMSGYRNLHRVIQVEEREKVSVEEPLTPE